MVELHSDRLDAVFHALSDPTRRAMLHRLSERESTIGDLAAPFEMSFAGASKHGVVGMTRALALEVAGKGVTVNSVCPGWVETDMLHRTIGNIARKTSQDDAAARALLLKGIPTGRFVAPAAVAELVYFLASEDARDVTGAAMPMDGGELA